MNRTASGPDLPVPADRVRVHMTGSAWFATTPGGLNRYFTDLFNALRTRPDAEVSAVAFGRPEAGGQTWGPAAGSTLRRACVSLSDDAALPSAAVIDRHFSLYGRARTSRRGRHPLVVHFHGPWADESRMAGASEGAARVKYLLERLRYAGADRFVVLSRHFHDVLVDQYHVPQERVRVIPPGVHLSRFGFSDSAARSPQMVLCVRRLERRMGIDVLLRSWQAVVAERPEAHLVVVGTGSQSRALQAQAADSGLGGAVTFTGRTDDRELATLYQRCAFTVVPTVALEGFGLIALESMAAGRAPVVTDCGGLPDSVRELDASLIVPSGDAEALADRILRALDGEVPAPQRCRAHAESFTWDVAAQRHVAMYQELLS
jgi:glycosyltransferase involved in cell wall biosynthesis